MSETTRLSIHGVPSRVALRVTSRQDQRATLEQRLPFLAIGTEVADDEGRTGRIARVNVALEGGVPKIVLELAYDTVPLRASRAPRRDETISYDRRSTAPPAASTDQRPTVPEPIRPQRSAARALHLEAGDRSLPLVARTEPVALAIPLEIRRMPQKKGAFAWLTRLFSPGET